MLSFVRSFEFYSLFTSSSMDMNAYSSCILFCYFTQYIILIHKFILSIFLKTLKIQLNYVIYPKHNCGLNSLKYLQKYLNNY